MYEKKKIILVLKKTEFFLKDQEALLFFEKFKKRFEFGKLIMFEFVFVFKRILK
jgi:hypothetical protein